MDSSSGWAMRRIMRLLARWEGGGVGASDEERCQRAKKRRGPRRTGNRMVAEDMAGASCRGGSSHSVGILMVEGSGCRMVMVVATASAVGGGNLTVAVGVA